MASVMSSSSFSSMRKVWSELDFHPSATSLAITVVAGLAPVILLFYFVFWQEEKQDPPPTGCRRLKHQQPSNLCDQYARRYASNDDASASDPWTVKAIFIYPIKSCAPIELSNAKVTLTGLQHDRQFAFAQHVTALPNSDGQVNSTWTFITQRTFPRLSKVQCQIWVPDPEAPGYDADGEWVKSEGCLVVRFPFTPDTDFSIEGFNNYVKILSAKMRGHSEPLVEFRVPFNPPQDRVKQKHYAKEEMKIWQDRPVAMNMGCEVPENVMDKLRYTLGVANPLTLFRIDTEKYREVSKCAPKKDDIGFQAVIGMHDSYPLHVLNLAAVHDVASRLPKAPRKLNALRFRPNILVTGPPAFDEDSWSKVRIGDGTFNISCRTTRCKLPNVNPETGIADRNQPGATMLKYRVVDPGSNSACLGMQATPIDWETISVWDTVEVSERGKHSLLKG